MGCVKYINITAGGKIRIVLNRQAEEYKRIYQQRTAAERIKSPAKALRAERLQVRKQCFRHNLNTLTYVVINVWALGVVRCRQHPGASLTTVVMLQPTLLQLRVTPYIMYNVAI